MAMVAVQLFLVFMSAASAASVSQHCASDFDSCGFIFVPSTSNGLHEWVSRGKGLARIRGNQGFKVIPRRPDMPHEKENDVMAIELGVPQRFRNKVGARTAISPGLEGTEFCVKFWYFLHNLGDASASIQFDTTDPTLAEYGTHRFAEGLWEQKRITISRYSSISPLQIKLIAQTAYNARQRYHLEAYHLVISDWSFKNESCIEDTTTNPVLAPLNDTKNGGTVVSLDTLPDCLGWSHTEENLCCGFDTTPQSPNDPFITACNSWLRQTPWFKYQFWILNYSDDPDIAQNVALFKAGTAYAISKCDEKPTTPRPTFYDGAVAAMRSKQYNPAGILTFFQITFWCYFNRNAEVKPVDLNHAFYLELSLSFPVGSNASDLPQRTIWGNISSHYESIKAQSWNFVTVEFAEETAFYLVFLAHHSENCQNKSENILIDSIDTRRGILISPCTATDTPTPDDATDETTSHRTSKGPDHTIDEVTPHTTIEVTSNEVTLDTTKEVTSDELTPDAAEEVTSDDVTPDTTKEVTSDEVTSVTTKEITPNHTTDEVTSKRTEAVSSDQISGDVSPTQSPLPVVTRPPNPCAGKRCGVGGKCMTIATGFRCQCLPDFVQMSSSSVCYCPVGKCCFY